MGSRTSCGPGADGLRAVTPLELGWRGVAVGVAVALIRPLLHNQTVNKLPLRAAGSKGSIAACYSNSRAHDAASPTLEGGRLRAPRALPMVVRRWSGDRKSGRSVGEKPALRLSLTLGPLRLHMPSSVRTARRPSATAGRAAAALAPADEPYPSARGEQLLRSSRNQQGQDHGASATLQIIVFRPHGGLNRRDSNG